jgi:uncharacterized protein YdiU (UPF0061 family)
VFAFDNSYRRLPGVFYAEVAPSPVRAPRVVKINRPLAELLGLDADVLASEEGARLLSGNAVPEGAASIALAYAGHQFGHFVPKLGDGRAILLGEIVGRDGKRRDVQLKGSGRTPFSRGGDGRAAIGPVLREYIVSEAMAALGIPTTRALAAVTTGEPVVRETLLPGAIFTRVAASHLRVGTFEYFAARGDGASLSALATYALHRHYPDACDTGNDALALLDRVGAAQAALVAQWLRVGFVHGVMNTDNTSISGETIDYGPCAFLDEYHPHKKFSSIDQGGRYAFSNQVPIAGWNVARLAEAILPLLDEREDEAMRLATASLERFAAKIRAEHARVVRRKLGLEREEDDDLALARDLFDRMTKNEVDHTLFFRRLARSAESRDGDADVASLFARPEAFHEWVARWRKRLESESASPDARATSMRATNPAFVPRNHRIEEVIRAAADDDDFAPFERMVRVLERPYDDQPDDAALAEPPRPEERVKATFCGT